MTLFLAHIKTNKKKIEYINAGHHPPILIGEKGMIYLDKGTIPLGILDIANVELGEADFNSNDMLFLYTDGLVEQTRQAGKYHGRGTSIRIPERETGI